MPTIPKNKAPEKNRQARRAEGAKASKLSPEDEALLEAPRLEEEDEAERPDGERETPQTGLRPEKGAPKKRGIPKPETAKNEDEVPEWVVFPKGLVIPPGKQLIFMKFRKEWTDTPEKGDRHVILWTLSPNDETFALKRARGDSQRTVPEMAKAMIRAFDGLIADFTGAPGPANVTTFWADIGGKCRTLIQSSYVRTHSLNAEETADFLHNCIAVRTSGR